MSISAAWAWLHSCGFPLFLGITQDRDAGHGGHSRAVLAWVRGSESFSQVTPLSYQIKATRKCRVSPTHSLHSSSLSGPPRNPAKVREAVGY